MTSGIRADSGARATGGSASLNWHRDFVLLWSGQTVSLLGSQVGALALPLVAVVSLHATPGEVGLLGVARFLPFVLLALPVGAMVDRRSRRPLMLSADVVRAGLVGVILVLHAIGALSVGWLYVIAFAVGVFQVVFDTAYQSFVPGLVGNRLLLDANRRLQASQSAADLAGPGLAGMLIQAAGAVGALIVDAASFLVSAACLTFIRHHEARPRRDSERLGPRERLAEMRAGLVVVFGRRDLRALAGEAATFNLFEQALLTLYVVYGIRELHLGAGTLGVTIAAAGVGSLLGAAVAGTAARRFGIGPTLVVSTLVGCASYLLIPLATGPRPMLLAVLAAGFGLAGVATGISNVQSVSLRQSVTPGHLLGRMNASFRLVAFGAIAVGAGLGGLLGELLGMRPAMFILAVGLLLGPVWILFSPIPAIRELHFGE